MELKETKEVLDFLDRLDDKVPEDGCHSWTPHVLYSISYIILTYILSSSFRTSWFCWRYWRRRTWRIQLQWRSRYSCYLPVSLTHYLFLIGLHNTKMVRHFDPFLWTTDSDMKRCFLAGLVQFCRNKVWLVLFFVFFLMADLNTVIILKSKQQRRDLLKEAF